MTYMGVGKTGRRGEKTFTDLWKGKGDTDLTIYNDLIECSSIETTDLSDFNITYGRHVTGILT